MTHNRKRTNDRDFQPIKVIPLDLKSCLLTLSMFNPLIYMVPLIYVLFKLLDFVNIWLKCCFSIQFHEVSATTTHQSAQLSRTATVQITPQDVRDLATIQSLLLSLMSMELTQAADQTTHAHHQNVQVSHNCQSIR